MRLQSPSTWVCIAAVWVTIRIPCDPLFRKMAMVRILMVLTHLGLWSRVPEPCHQSQFRAYTSAAVATDTNPCSQIGSDILRLLNGSATDAAIAATFCVGAVNFHNSGVGGGHVALIYDTPRGGGEKEMVTIMARERAPLAAYRDMFVGEDEIKGPRSIGVPGEVAGLYMAWERYGRVPWKALILPSVRLCEEGIRISESMGRAINVYAERIRNIEGCRSLLVKEDDTMVMEGDIVQLPKLANTLRIIAENPHDFYNGSLADDIVQELKDLGSIIVKDDLLSYTAAVKKTLEMKLVNGNYTVHTPSAPFSGPVLQYILNILDGYMFDASSIENVNKTVLTYHRVAEAFKFAHAKKGEFGDEDFVDVQKLQRELTSPEYGARTRARITDNTTQEYLYYEPSYTAPEDHGTTHLTVYAADGAAVTISSTIYHYFGSMMVGPKTGIIYNDQMNDFSTPGVPNYWGEPPSPANYIQPGKVPASSMCPTIVLDGSGDVAFVTGASGGSTIPTAISFVLMHSLWFGQHLLMATDTRRLHHQLQPDVFEYEGNSDKEVIEGLRVKGHEMKKSNMIRVVQSIRNVCAGQRDVTPEVKCIHAVSDARKGRYFGRGGVPDGY